MSKTIVSRSFIALSLAGAVAGCGAEPLDGADVEATRSAICASNQLTPTAAISSGTPKQAASKAIDGSTTTRWESEFSDPQWLVLDLGAVKDINRVQIDWETANAQAYRIDVSNDNVTWSAPVVDVGGLATGNHRIDNWTGFNVPARYVRMYGTRRNTQYGYSIWEMRVYGDVATCADGTNLLTAGWTSAGANFTPTSVYTIGTTNKNAISMNYTGKTFTLAGLPSTLDFKQNVTATEGGTAWRLTLTISGMNNQATQPPRFMAELGGAQSSTFWPNWSTVYGDFRAIRVATLTTGNTLTLDFTATLVKGQTYELDIHNAPYFDANNTSTHKLNITDAKFTRLQ
jgi:hypothetical protein